MVATVKEVVVPDIGDFKNVDIIEVLVAPGDVVKAEQSLITLESDKASMEIPSPESGMVKELRVKVGDKVSQGSPILMLEVGGEAARPTPTAAAPASPTAPERPDAKPEFKQAAEVQTTLPAPGPVPPPAARPEAPPPEAPRTGRPPPAGTLPEDKEVEQGLVKAHASPSVRRFARELGVDLSKVRGTGPKDRVLKDDVQAYVKAELSQPERTGTGFALPEMPQVDFAAFGPIEVQPFTRIKKLSGANLHRNWLHIPHVTQFDEADITDLEAFRRAQAGEAEKRGVKLTLLTFLMKASVAALKAFPDFNASLDAGGESLVLKKYFHIGVAVDTPQGLVVPVIRDVDRKGLFDLAGELRELSAKAREGKLVPRDLQGGCFTISSLGGLGGTHFTPIVNAPEVAILGVSRAQMRPVYENGQFVPRLILPLALSYDHRVIDGAAGVRFTSYLANLLTDTRRLLL
jgi:pyruvate dehydrogenase E2 component (dihydrolipoamide acetyltransferase)